MCLSAVYWAKIKKIYFGCTKEDAEKIGFDDKFIYDVIKGKKKKIFNKMINRKYFLKVFNKWKKDSNHIQY
jgi:guanine deaminase